MYLYNSMEVSGDGTEREEESWRYDQTGSDQVGSQRP